MKLIYLWIEEYKNIKNQGFSFAPEFKCSYDNASNTLTINENKEYKSIFPNNISVTAIVGENGSGKSNLLLNILENLTKRVKDLISNNFILVTVSNNELSIITTLTKKNIKCNLSCKIVNIPLISQNMNNDEIIQFQKNYIARLFDYSLGFTNDNSALMNNIYPHKNLSIKEIKQQDLRNIIYYIKSENHRDMFGDYFMPVEFLIETTYFEKKIIDNSTLKNKYGNLAELQNSLDSAIDKFLFIIYEYLSSELSKLSSNNNLEGINSIHELESFYQYLNDKIQNNTEAEHLKKILVYARKIYKNSLKEIITLESDQVSNSSYGIRFKILKEKFDVENNFYLLSDLPYCFNIDFKDKNKRSYNNLSNGEKSALRLRCYIDNEINKNKDCDSFIFLLDEPNNDLHPQWQKRLVQYLIESFQDTNTNLHIVITTHSPFLLSDLPKENIIFLENGKQKDVDIETFGANIHTLLSHGFFMKDGLMGTFAKSKIDTAIKYLNRKKLSEDEIKECEHIISIVGEPIIKRQLQKMLDSKKINYIADDVKQEIEFLQHRIDMLRKNR